MLTFSGLIMPFERRAYTTEFRNQYLAIFCYPENVLYVAIFWTLQNFLSGI
jgi:hypothetical protein